jgi:bifunctional DNA-binding transcriptional regulator/antitoxin component of YhaV-PrlF toxin-antitoxin module
VEHVYYAKLGDSRRLALPAGLCRELGLLPGELLLLTTAENGLIVSSLRHQAERMRHELRDMLGKGKPLTDDLKQLRKAEAVREADPR